MSRRRISINEDLSRVLAERCTRRAEAVTSCDTFWAAYRTWSEANGYTSAGVEYVADYLRSRRGVQQDTIDRDGRPEQVWRGLELL